MPDYAKLQNGSDVRGVAEGCFGREVTLTAQAAADIACGFAGWLSDRTGKSADSLRIAVGRDSRTSGPLLCAAVCNALQNCGAEVLDAGLASTPAMFMACVFGETACDGSVMLTASHLPADRNGLKFFEREKGGLDKQDIEEILAVAGTGFRESEIKGARGSCREYPLMELYCAHLRRVISEGLGAEEEDAPLAGLRVAVDAGNGAGGFYAYGVLAPLGADVSPSQFLEADGRFPNHAPNPEDAEAVSSLCARVLSSGADLGIIFDTDVDRMAVAGSGGRPVARNAIVALAALLSSDRGTIVTDSITSTQLSDFLKARGYGHLRYKRGYRNVINKARELNAAGTFCPLAIETSGHAALKDNYFLDDGAYLAALIVVEAAKLKRRGLAIESLIADLKEPAEAAEYRLAVKAEDFGSYAAAVLAGVEAAAKEGSGGFSPEEPNYEGVRVSCAEERGWFLIRRSLHEPLMPVNIESDVPGGNARIAGKLAKILEKYELLDSSALAAAGVGGTV